VVFGRSEEVDVGLAIRGLCPLIQVFDMPTSLRFYRDVLGFVVVQKSGQDLEGAYAYLVSRGVKAQPPEVAPYGTKQLYATDPDGYGVCFQWAVDQGSRTTG
jgi:glyoxylase I family protein